MKKNFVHKLLALAVLAVLTLGGAAPVSAYAGEGIDDVSLVTKMNSGREHAVIIATDSDGLPVWTVRTEQYDAAQLSAFADIGIWQDQYYYVERGKVVCLDLNTGSKKWENSDFQGSPAQYCHIIKEDGTVYLSGYFGPDFYAIDCSGNTLGRVDQIDPAYYWPVSLNVAGDTVSIRMEGTPDGTEAEISVNLYDCLHAGAAPAAGNTAAYDNGGWTDEDLVWMAGEYYAMLNGERPPVVEVDSVDGNQVTLHLYENMSDHTATWGWYYIDRTTLRGYDLLGNAVDFNVLAA